MSRLQDKVCIITGAASGIGRAIALAYAKEGGIIVSADLQPEPRGVGEGEPTEATHELITASGGKAIFVKTDVGKGAEVQAAVQAAVKEFGRVDVFVNNAGISIESRVGAAKRTHETDDETWDTTMAINARSVFFGCKYAAAQMLEQEPHSSGDRGWIINIASIAALIGLPSAVSYSASKGSVTSMTRTISLEYAADRIHVNAICPGFIHSSLTRDMQANNDQAIPRFGPLHPFGGGGLGMPDDIASAAVFLASSDSKWVTGTALTVDGGYTAH